VILLRYAPWAGSRARRLRMRLPCLNLFRSPGSCAAPRHPPSPLCGRLLHWSHATDRSYRGPDRSGALVRPALPTNFEHGYHTVLGAVFRLTQELIRTRGALCPLHPLLTPISPTHHGGSAAALFAPAPDHVLTSGSHVSTQRQWRGRQWPRHSLGFAAYPPSPSKPLAASWPSPRERGG